jgi:cation transport ATPase
MTHEYTITGITCKSCVSKVKSELLKLGEVTNAEVQLNQPQATITMQKHISTTTLQQVVSKAGNYTIADFGNHTSAMRAHDEENNSYYPIFLIFGFIAGVCLLVQFGNYTFNWMVWMRHFMAGFFLVFSFFKLLNIKDFAQGYSTYDIVAKHAPAYGFIYPFIELVFAIALLLNLAPLLVNIAIATVMFISTIGVIKTLLQKRTVQCACLGTIIKLPLSKVTLFEDLLMTAMSIAMMFMTMI